MTTSAPQTVLISPDHGGGWSTAMSGLVATDRAREAAAFCLFHPLLNAVVAEGRTGMIDVALAQFAREFENRFGVAPYLSNRHVTLGLAAVAVTGPFRVLEHDGAERLEFLDEWVFAPQS